MPDHSTNVASRPCSVRARFVDVGLLAPAVFHATYEGIAHALVPGDPPVVMWGRARAHVSLGQGQDEGAELDGDPGVPVVKRPLGGGAVWIDESQYCVVLIAPLEHAPARPAEWYGWALAPMVATYRGYGLPALRRDQDIWLHGRKIAGSGAATLGRCAVLASSFLLQFPAARFARCVASPSAEFRAWLADGLEQAMTDWSRHQVPPAGPALQRAYRHQVECAWGWRCDDSAVSATETAARDAVLDEPDESVTRVGRRAVPGGIKLNAAMWLTETRCDDSVVRLLARDGAVLRRSRNAA